MVCMSELRGLGAVNAELKQRGGQVLAIAVDPPELARAVVEKQKLDFPILCDTEAEVIQAYGLVHSGAGPGGSDIAIPASVLIDRNGAIVWKRVARRAQDRPDPRDVIRIIQTMNSL